MFRKFAFAAVAALALGSYAFAQADKDDDDADDDIKPLTIGDPARPINIEHWLKGDKVTKFEPGKVYVLEFWATWCGPCRQSMPHITKMQQDYKDYNVTFISVSDEKLETVKEFLTKTDKASDKTWNEVIGYTLTTDPDMSVKNDYFKAAGQRGIPCAFIIGKDTKIEWIGNPHPKSDDHFDAALESVVKGTWDRKAFKTQWEKENSAQREEAKAQDELREAMKAKDWDKVMAILDQQIATSDKAVAARMQKFMILLVQMDQPKKAYAFGNEVAKANWDDAQLLNGLAWTVVDTPGIKTRDLDFAFKLANRAVEVTKEKDGMILDTLARVYHDKGDLAKAVEIQKKAVANPPENAPTGMMDQLKDTLKKYQDELANEKG